MPVAVAPAVDALLDVAHDEQGMPFACQHIGYQGAEHLPLERAGILELIYHDVLVADTGFLQYEVRVALFERIAQGVRCFREQHTVLVLQTGLYLLQEALHQPHIVQARTGEHALAVYLPAPRRLLVDTQQERVGGLRQFILRQPAEPIFARKRLVAGE